MQIIMISLLMQVQSLFLSQCNVSVNNNKIMTNAEIINHDCILTSYNSAVKRLQFLI